MNYAVQYETYLEDFEKALQRAMAQMNYLPAVLSSSMRYSLKSGGKRVRPVLFYAMAEILGADYRKERNFAVAIECIHTYSLIHDDLPAMDNDDYRRGRLSNHKVYGEANAILAGDALLSFAFDLLLKECGRGERQQRAALALSKAAGPAGMIAGQSADLLYTGREASEKELLFIDRHKTGKLIAAPLKMAAILAGRHEAEAENFGERLGELFQLTDDVLDEKGNGKEVGKTLGKDKRAGKVTYVKLYGLRQAETVADGLQGRCLDCLDGIDADTSFLKELVYAVRNRNK